VVIVAVYGCAATPTVEEPNAIDAGFSAGASEILVLQQMPPNPS
jgi:hypothetical protein